MGHDAHYWKYLYAHGRIKEYLELEIRAVWAKHTLAVQQRLIKHGYAPDFVGAA